MEGTRAQHVYRVSHRRTSTTVYFSLILTAPNRGDMGDLQGLVPLEASPFAFASIAVGGDADFPDDCFLGHVEELCSHGCQISSGVDVLRSLCIPPGLFPIPMGVSPDINCVFPLPPQDRPSANLSHLHPPPVLVCCRGCLCASFLCVHGLQMCCGGFGLRNSDYYISLG